MTAVEEWRPIPGHVGYEASSLGRIRSVDRVIAHGGKTGAMRTLRGKTLSPTPNGPYGYLSVMLGAGCRRYVHRLVALTFIGPIEGMDVDHGDDDPSNNAVSNLSIVPHKTNLRAMSDRRTHCTNGHELTADNTVARGRSRRACRTCVEQWEQGRKERAS